MNMVNAQKYLTVTSGAALLFCVPSATYAVEEGIKIYGIELGQLIELSLLLFSILGGLLGLNWARLKTISESLIVSKIQNEKIQSLLFTVAECALPIVKNLYRETVKDLKEKSGDGKLTEDEVQQITEEAVSRLKEACGNVLDELFHTMNISHKGFNDLLRGIIRVAVTRSKKEGN